MATTRKFTTTSIGPEVQPPVAVLAESRIDALIGHIIQLDGRKSYDPQNKPLTWKWRFTQVPIGSLVESVGLAPIRANGRVVRFVPDKIGIYVVELVVNNGDLDSDPTTIQISIQISRVPCGEGLVPDAHFLWNYISNFWSLVDDREVITTIWSAVIQLIGADLITLWSNDNNKSLATIQRTFQRRWVGVDMTTYLLGETDHRIITGKTDSGNRASTGDISGPTSDEYTSVVYTEESPPRSITGTDFTNLKGNYGDRGRLIIVNGEAYTINRTDNREGSSIAVVDQEIVPNGQHQVPWRVPHLLHMPGVDFWEAGVRAGDVLVFEVTRRDIGLSAELRTQVVGVDRSRVGFEFTLGELEDGAENIDLELFKQLVLDLRIAPITSTEAETAAFAKTLIKFIPVGINLNTRPFTTYRVVFRAKRIIHNTRVEVDPALVSMPTLQETIKSPPLILRENLDYVVEDGGVEFVGTLFTLEDPAPEVLWSECVFFDNGQAIENNFGRLVGLLKDDLSDSAARTPYLSAVKGLFYAFVNGPDIANIRLGLQILLGLPFAEEQGIILEVVEFFSVSESGIQLGRLLMEDLDQNQNRTGVRRFYFYPMSLGLEDNPTTGETYKLGDIVSQFAPLSKGVAVDDYVTSPYWWQDAGIPELLKFFTHQASISAPAFQTGEITLALNFLQIIKPTYTGPFTTALLDFSGDDPLDDGGGADDIVIDEDFGGDVEVNLYDNAWGLEAVRQTDNINHQGAVLYRVGQVPFSTRTVRRLNDVRTTRDVELPLTTKIRVYSAVGWDTDLIRGRDDSAYPIVEGDLFVIFRGQSGASLDADAMYEVDLVVDDHNLELRATAPAADPETYVKVPIDFNNFEIGTNLKCCILRRETNPVIRKSDLTTSSANNIVTSVSGFFVSNGVRIGDYFIIEDGSDAGHYMVDASVTPLAADYPREYPKITETSLALKNLDGTTPTLSDDTNISYRVVRPEFIPIKVEKARSYYNSDLAQIEIEVLDPVDPVGTGDPNFDVFVPALVGNYIEITNSQNPVNDGRFLVTEYVNAGRIVTNSASTTSDTTAISTLYLEAQSELETQLA
jgi:hypothetical protein